MGLSTSLFMMALLLSGAASTKSQAYFNETGHLPCHFTNPQNISLDELVVFWQNQDKMVLYELYKGKENSKNVNAYYKGRTSLDKDNWTLRLLNVQIKDKGSYQCFIHRKGPQGMLSIHQTSTDLEVLANFSQPEIMLISNRTENPDIVNLTCSSAQGYPEPEKMSFLNTTGNSTAEYDDVMNIFQDNITGLYSVSISRSFPVSPQMNVSIFCVLQLKPTQTQLLSRPYNIDAKPHKPPLPAQDYHLIAAVLVLSLVLACLPVLLLIRRRRRSLQGSSPECEAIKVEGDESKQTKKRVESHDSDRSDEAQCSVHTSKS